MKQSQLLRAVCLPMLLLSQQGYATTVYNESSSGDLSEVGTEPVLDFNSGINSVLGNATITQTASSSFDADHFSFVVPAGTQLTSMSVEYTNIAMHGTTTELSVAYYLRDAFNVPVGSSGFVSVSDSGAISIPMSGLPAGPDSYKLTTTYGWDGDFADGGTFDYSLNFSLTAVPVPGAILLFGSGLLGLFGFAGSRFKRVRLD